MPLPDFRESIYQFFFLHEILTKYGGLPRWKVDIPTLQAEGGTPYKAPLGYDAMLKDNLRAFAFYLQFKIPRHRTQKNPAEEAKKIFTPYWAFHIQNRVQHNTLVALAAPGVRVYYVTPVFLKDLYGRGVAQRVRLESACIRPNIGHHIKKTDKKDHQYRYWEPFAASKCKYYSEEMGAEVYTFDDIGSVLENGTPEARPIGEIVEQALLVFAHAGLLDSPFNVRISLEGEQTTTMENFDTYLRALHRLDISLVLMTEFADPFRTLAKTASSVTEPASGQLAPDNR